MEQSDLVSSCIVSVGILGASLRASIISARTCSAILYCVEQSAFVFSMGVLGAASCPVVFCSLEQSTVLSSCVFVFSSCILVFSVGILRAVFCPVVHHSLEQSSILSSWLKCRCAAPHCILDSGKLYCTIFPRPDKLSRWIISRPIFWSVEFFRGICSAHEYIEQPSR